MANVIIYTKKQCPYCDMAKKLLSSRGISFEEIQVDIDETKLQEMMQRSNKRTVPQIFINDQPIGGYDDLAALATSGKLDGLLNPSQ